ncbi:hypothetical protein P3S68_019712 [Capsicum galapagoense]
MNSCIMELLKNTSMVLRYLIKVLNDLICEQTPPTFSIVKSFIVVYMGLSTLHSLASKLIHHGLPADTPAVAVERGITPQQRMGKVL